MKRLISTALLSLLIAAPSAATSDNKENAAKRDIISIASQDGRFTTLAAALTAADLVETLQGAGPFTVFAPTDEAFAKLPAGTVEDLLRPENSERLLAILTYHVVSGRIRAHDLLSTASAKTVSGTLLPIGLSIGGAAIIETDIRASNGIIHVIDSVILPGELPRAARTMTDSPRDIISLAISMGAPLFNDGNAAACAAVYEVAARALLGREDVPPSAADALRGGLRMASRSHGADDKAWRLREGLDKAFRMMNRRSMSESAGH